VSIQRLTSILNEEFRAPAPHLCIAFAAQSQIFVTIGKIASTSQDEGVILEAIASFGTLVDSEEEEFLGDDVFATSLMNFTTKTIGAGAFMAVGQDTEVDFLELMFGIANKIRLQPEILPVWFNHGEKERAVRVKREGEADEGNKWAGVTHKEDFPLFYVLIDYMHHDGRVGDFARMGLVFIIESASRSRDLERWIVESDLSTLMASGLGALYSQLGRYVFPSISQYCQKMVLILLQKALHTILKRRDAGIPSSHFV
jgi:Retinoic acid induced 16-like protein